MARSLLLPHKDTIEALESEWEEIQEEFAARIAAHMEERGSAWSSLETELKAAQPKVTEDDAPLAQDADERNDALFDSSRSYMEQNTFYQARKIESGLQRREKLAARSREFRRKQKKKPLQATVTKSGEE